MKIKTYAVNSFDAWLNTEGDDISDSYVKYKDHQEAVAELQSALDVQTARSEALEAELKQSQIDAACYKHGMEQSNQRLNELAAENGQMLRLLTDISENHLEYLSEGEDCMMAGVPLDYVSEVNMYVSRDVNAENPFKETDVFLAEIQADAILFASYWLPDNGKYQDFVQVLAQEVRNGDTEVKFPVSMGKGAAHTIVQTLRGNSNGGAL